MFRRLLVEKRSYLQTEELLELNALCQMLPGPTSTQTLTAVAFRLGGAKLAYLTLAIWILPSVLVMAGITFGLQFIEKQYVNLQFTCFIQPVVVGLVAQAAVSFALRTVNGSLDAGLLIGAMIISYLFPSPYVAPVLLLCGGVLTAIRFRRRHPKVQKEQLKIQWANFILWIGVFLAAAIAGRITHYFPVILFENFYRNGSLIFGGGQMLVPLLYNEFVTFKQVLSQEEFLFGYAITQVLPGPIFAFCTYVGGLAGRPYGLTGIALGAGAATLGIFLPGTFLIFFIIRFWAQLKQYRVVKAGLEGINAASAGLVFCAALQLFKPLPADTLNVLLIGLSFAILQFTKIAPWMLVLAAILLGILWQL